MEKKMRLCDECIKIFEDAGYIVTEEPLAYGEYTYKKCENCKNRYAMKVKVIKRKMITNAVCADCDYYHPVDENNGERPLHGFVGDFSIGCKEFKRIQTNDQE